MAYGDNEQFSTRSFSGRPRMVVERNKVATFKVSAGEELLPVGTPVAWDDVSDQWVPYTQPSDAAIYTITDQNAGTDGGSFDLFIDGLGVIDLAWNTTPAAAQTAINAVLLDAGVPYTVACTCTEANLGTASAVLTITFSENAGAPSVAINTEKITDGGTSEPSNLVLAASDAGTQLVGANVIAGFVAHDPVQLDDADEVLGVVMLEGEVHAADINTAAIRAVLQGSPSENELNTALKAASLRMKGLHVRGLADVAG